MFLNLFYETLFNDNLKEEEKNKKGANLFSSFKFRKKFFKIIIIRANPTSKEFLLNSIDRII